MADQWGLTLIGYARRNSFKLYSHPERIIHTNQSEDLVKEP
jgi:formate dehydrogenase assembly factor FdhD